MRPAKLTGLTGLTLALSTAISFAAEPAEDAARKWLGLLDRGEFDASHNAAARFFKKAISRKDWHEQLVSVRAPLGRVAERKVVTTTGAKILPGAPDGDYTIFTFETSFKGGDVAMETVTVSHEPDGAYRVIGYFIRSVESKPSEPLGS